MTHEDQKIMKLLEATNAVLYEQVQLLTEMMEHKDGLITEYERRISIYERSENKSEIAEKIKLFTPSQN